MQTEVIRMNRTPEYRLRDHRVREELLSKANSLLGILNQTRSYNLKRRLFANSILYKFAYGSKYMRKFVLYGDRKPIAVPPAEVAQDTLLRSLALQTFFNDDENET